MELNGPVEEKSPILHPMNKAAESGELLEDGEPEKQEGGMNTWQTGITMIAFCTDYSLLTVEMLILATGWLGFLFVILICCGLVYTTILLGRCWNMVREKWQSERQPFGAITYEAFGGSARCTTNVLVGVCCFTVSIGVITITAENLFIVGGPALHGKFCYLPLVIAAVAYPFTWFGSPKDLWQLSAMGAFTGSLAFLLTFIGVVTDNGATDTMYTNVTSISDVAPSSGTYLLHLAEMTGIVQFGIGCHYFFPTVHQDMAHPQKYTQTVLASYSYIAFLALPLLAVTFFSHLNELADTTADSTILALLHRGPLFTVPAVLFLIRNIVVTVTCNNPLFQWLEEHLNIPQEFSWKRVVLRTSVLLIEVFICETIPHFGILVSLIGGSCLPVVALLAPTLCYLRLRSIHTPDRFNKAKSVWMLETVVCWLIIAITPILIFAVMYVTLSGIFQRKTVFTVPCYVDASLAHE